ncbi:MULTISPECIES: AraC family transcriptional regulator [Pontibacillus]|uniref:AraC family transcriptional regulator n=1 Tax=Pontibacillus chungwhensis TaxID=265426 RepID=A0ABY8UY67_9BACI|nr:MULTISPECIES: AraC family transcriptional regulator [Pontibacillus]MCD5323990.1 AraC family transcriptional regulator [Pontibacillus sp. HN14]WIF97947.1 AraC family transcriptional regulator [Pontibacillus chungwhensis]
MSTSIKQATIEQFMKVRLQNRNHDYLHPSYLMERQLLVAVSQGDQEKAHQLLHSINEERAIISPNPTLRSVKNVLVSSCTLFTRTIIHSGVQPEDAFELSDHYVELIERTDDVEQLFQLEREMLKQFIERLNKEETLPYSKVVNQAIAFIHDRILEDLTLDSIAQNSLVSPSYLSHLFKKEVGVSVVQYINQKRIEESKYFLLHTTTPISDIATLFQFCNQSYYTSLFKKYTSVTPKEFRESHSKVGQETALS